MTTPICITCGNYITGKAHRDYDNHHEKTYLCDPCWTQFVEEQLLLSEVEG
jgi:DNA-directed RNA polymerase subunit RPC12/RpoP